MDGLEMRGISASVCLNEESVYRAESHGSLKKLAEVSFISGVGAAEVTAILSLAGIHVILCEISLIPNLICPEVPVSPSQFRLIRISGLGVCLTLLMLRLLLLSQRGILLLELLHAWWLIAMAVFVVTLWMGTRDRKMSETRRTLLLAGQSASVLTMAFLMGGMHAGNYLGFLLLIITWQLALSVPMRVALPWVLGQAVLLALAYVIADHADWTTAAVSVIFKSFTYIVVLTLKRESDAKAAYAALNAEMLATREMLAERSRANERLRISRDLHDVLGHRLTALSLNLEIAMNKATLEDGRGEILQAQSMAKKLLQEVRDVVSTMRSTDRVDLCEALHELAIGFAPLDVHLNIPPQLRSCDAGRAEVLIRCAQELITNAVKHAAARQIWIDLELSEQNVLSICSHDDGNGATTAASRSGIGLKAMQERFENFGGRVQVWTDPKEGFMMMGFLPMYPIGETA